FNKVPPKKSVGNSNMNNAMAAQKSGEKTTAELETKLAESDLDDSSSSDTSSSSEDDGWTKYRDYSSSTTSSSRSLLPRGLFD
ncbi:hypothetical protein L9F63_000253, partial [Diploptera punctata]